jgi:hypothetical protein
VLAARNTLYVNILPQSTEVTALLKKAQHEGLIVRAPDGTELMLTAVDEFDYEIAQTRRNTKLMALLEERARQQKTVPLGDVKRDLGLDE